MLDCGINANSRSTGGSSAYIPQAQIARLKVITEESASTSDINRIADIEVHDVDSSTGGVRREYGAAGRVLDLEGGGGVGAVFE